MANRYSAINPARFTPFTMQEIFTPPSLMRQQHDAADASAMEMQALDVNRLPQDEGLVGTKLGDLRSKIADVSNQLATSGFDRDIQNNLLNIRKEYIKEMSPSGDLGRANTNYQEAKKGWDLMKDYYIKQGASPEFIKNASDIYFNQSYKGLASGDNQFIPGKTSNYYNIEDEVVETLKNANFNILPTGTNLRNFAVAETSVPGVYVLRNTHTGQILENSEQIASGIASLKSRFLDPYGRKDEYLYTKIAGLDPRQVNDLIDSTADMMRTRQEKGYEHSWNVFQDPATMRGDNVNVNVTPEPTFVPNPTNPAASGTGRKVWFGADKKKAINILQPEYRVQDQEGIQEKFDGIYVPSGIHYVYGTEETLGGAYENWAAGTPSDKIKGGRVVLPPNGNTTFSGHKPFYKIAKVEGKGPLLEKLQEREGHLVTLGKDDRFASLPLGNLDPAHVKPQKTANGDEYLEIVSGDNRYKVWLQQFVGREIVYTKKENESEYAAPITVVEQVGRERAFNTFGIESPYPDPILLKQQTAPDTGETLVSWQLDTRDPGKITSKRELVPILSETSNYMNTLKAIEKAAPEFTNLPTLTQNNIIQLLSDARDAATKAGVNFSTLPSDYDLLTLPTIATNNGTISIMDAILGGKTINLNDEELNSFYNFNRFMRAIEVKLAKKIKLPELKYN